jgi:alpha-tubulin suppressor-like RCC1 family protein
LNKILGSGKLYIFGYNHEGNLGLKTGVHVIEPQELKFFENFNVKNIICGGYHTFVILGNDII